MRLRYLGYFETRSSCNPGSFGIPGHSVLASKARQGLRLNYIRNLKKKEKLHLRESWTPGHTVKEGVDHER